MKKKIIALVTIAALLAISVTGTLAYFTDQKTATNEITMGAVGIAIKETTTDGSGAEIPWSEGGVIGAMPGDVTPKKVTVVNNADSQPAWIRVKAEISMNCPNAPEGFNPDLSLVTLDYNTTDWTYGGDGWYYYNVPLAAGEETEPLFTTVTLSLTMGNEYMDATVAVDVTAQAVQSANNGDSVQEAAGWSAP